MRTIPIIMDASKTIAVGATVAFHDESRLRVPCARGMFLDEIRIIAPENPAVAPFGNAQVKFRFRTWDITNDLVNIRFLGPRFTSLVANSQVWQTCWRLPKPMFIPQGELLIPTIKNGYPAGGSNKFIVAYVGRELPDEEPVPREVTLPFIADYLPTLPVPVATAFDLESTSNQICNPFSEPLYVYRLMGGYVTPSFDLGRQYLDSYKEQLTVMITDSHGETIVRDATPFSHLFPQRGPGWLVKTVLQPGDYWRVVLHGEAASTVQPEIAMFGYHTVQLT